MSQGKFPSGWDEEKVRRLEDEAGVEPAETVMNVPHDLVAKVRELIAKRQG